MGTNVNGWMADGIMHRHDGLTTESCNNRDNFDDPCRPQLKILLRGSSYVNSGRYALSFFDSFFFPYSSAQSIVLQKLQQYKNTPTSPLTGVVQVGVPEVPDTDNASVQVVYGDAGTEEPLNLATVKVNRYNTVDTCVALQASTGITAGGRTIPPKTTPQA